MKSLQSLPENYRLIWALDMRQRQNLIIANLVGLVILIFSAWGFSRLAASLRPDAHVSLSVNGISGLIIILALVVSTIVMVVIHEGFHGICFWIFTRSRPRFALRAYYAYASADGWYLPKWPYFVTALAPLLGISLLGILGIAFGPNALILPILLILIFNTSGAVGDLWVAAALLVRSNATYVRDSGDQVEFFEPSAGAAKSAGLIP